MITPWIINALVTAGLVKTGEAIGNAMSGGDNNSNEQPKFETINGPSNSGNSGSSNGGSSNKEEETSGSNSAGNTSSSNNSSNSNSSSGTSSASASSPSVMSPETSDIAEIYEVLAPMAGNYMNAQAEQIGQAQRSMGTLAGRTMGSSRTAGLGNYTYNRLMRPQADAMRDELLVKGYATQLNQLLSNALNNAKNRYNSKSSTDDDTNGNNASGVTKISGSGTKVKPKGTIKHALPSSYEFEDANGQWHRVNRTNESDDEWIRIYEGAKKKAAEEGRGFNG